MTIKIHILYNFKGGAWGGANQFLKALKNIWVKNGIYTENVTEADVIIINSHHFELKEKQIFFKTVYNFKKKKDAIIIHRLAGPIFLARGFDLTLDKLIFHFNRIAADGTIFQSEWSKDENLNLGYTKNIFEITIPNAPDKEIFYPLFKNEMQKKIRIVASSWSENLKKGFEIYEYLDKYLDFSKFEMTFIGNSPVTFKKIKHIQPVPSEDLADILRQQDIYITASRVEACSNSLLEAIHCGLPSVYFKGTSHGNIVGNGGAGFSGTEDVIEVIETVAQNLEYYQSNLNPMTIDEVAEEYYQFCRKVFTSSQKGNYYPKPFTYYSLWRLKLNLSLANVKSYLSLILGSVKTRIKIK